MTEAAARPNRDRLRLIVYLFLVTACFGFLQPFVPLYMEAAGLAKSQIGLATGIGTGLALIIQPLLGRLSDHWDRRRPLISLSALAAGIAYLAFPHAEGFPTFLALTAVGANGTMYLNAAGAVLVGRMVSRERGGGEYARVRVWGSVGYIVVSVLSGLLVQLAGPFDTSRAALDIVFRTGPLIFIAIAVIAWILPDRRNQLGTQPEGKLAVGPNLRRFLVAYFLYTFALYGSSPYLSLYMKSLGAGGLWLSGMFAGGVIVEVLVMSRSGMLSDIYGRRPALALAFVLLPIRLLLYIPATGPWWVAAVQTLHGINFGIVGAVAIAFANDLATETTHGRAQARLAATAGLASAVGPVVLGFVSQDFGLRGMFAASAFVAAGAAAVLVFGVHDSHESSNSVAELGPERLRGALRWLDAPPKKRKP